MEGSWKATRGDHDTVSGSTSAELWPLNWGDWAIAVQASGNVNLPSGVLLNA